MLKLSNSSSLYLLSRLTLNSSWQISTFILLCLFMRIQLFIKIRFKKKYRSKSQGKLSSEGFVPFLTRPPLKWIDIFSMTHLFCCDLYPKSYHQRRKGGYFFPICLHLFQDFSEWFHCTCLHALLTKLWIAGRRDEPFPINFYGHGFLSYCCWMYDLENIFYLYLQIPNLPFSFVTSGKIFNYIKAHFPHCKLKTKILP